MRVLLAEDDPIIADGLVRALRKAGYAVDHVDNGLDADTAVLSQTFDLLILDLGLPKLPGIEVLRRLRARKCAVPVLILTAQDGVEERVRGLDAGADDYLTKPFALPELEVRLEALMARVHGRQRRKVLEVHDLKLDLATLEATRAGQPLHLYPACRKLLETLMQASPAAVTRQQLEHALWGDHPPDGDMLRSHIYELRRSVDGPFPVKLIQTLPRTGYRLAVPHASGDA